MSGPGRYSYDAAGTPERKPRVEIRLPLGFRQFEPLFQDLLNRFDATEDRLQRIEQKLDRVLTALELADAEEKPT